ncbi:MAG: DUF4292 domain-containing protein [Bacteroidota bacterium]
MTGNRVFQTLVKTMGIFTIGLIMSSCKSTKTIASGETDRSLSAKKIIENHYNNQTDFETLNGRVKIDYSDGRSSQGVTVSLRMEKDKVIWISAPLGMLKANITPGKVSFYNKLEGEYFEGDFEYLSNLLGTALDFEKVQNVILGNALFNLNDDKYVTENNTKHYGLKLKKDRELFKTLFLIEPVNFKMAEQLLTQPIEDRLLRIQYDYQEIKEKVLPNEIAITASVKNKTNTISLEFKGLELNKKLNYPYKIPKGFKAIVLK